MGVCGKLFLFCFRKATCDVDLNDQSFMDNRLQWADVKSRLRTSTVSISGGLVVCMSLFREVLSQSFFPYFCPLCPHDFIPNL